jgi:hypothetical protein
LCQKTKAGEYAPSKCLRDPIRIILTEVGRYVDDGWHMTGEELSKMNPSDPVIIHRDSDERRPARFMISISPTVYDCERGEERRLRTLANSLGI